MVRILGLCQADESPLRGTRVHWSLGMPRAVWEIGLFVTKIEPVAGGSLAASQLRPVTIPIGRGRSLAGRGPSLSTSYWFCP